MPDITGWDWDWGDGTTHGTTQTANHEYAGSGMYYGTLTVTDDDSQSASIQFVVRVAQEKEIVSWDWDWGDESVHGNEQVSSHEYDESGVMPVVLTIEDNTGDSAVSEGVLKILTPGTQVYSSWDFGDGNVSTEENPSHEYLKKGVKTVSLQLQNASETVTETKTGYIVVLGKNKFKIMSVF
jgi:PKD repeat protein